jgi:hypothetical protein
LNGAGLLFPLARAFWQEWLTITATWLNRALTPMGRMSRRATGSRRGVK